MLVTYISKPKSKSESIPKNTQVTKEKWNVRTSNLANNKQPTRLSQMRQPLHHSPSRNVLAFLPHLLYVSLSTRSRQQNTPRPTLVWLCLIQINDFSKSWKLQCSLLYLLITEGVGVGNVQHKCNIHCPILKTELVFIKRWKIWTWRSFQQLLNEEW